MDTLYLTTTPAPSKVPITRFIKHSENFAIRMDGRRCSAESYEGAAIWPLVCIGDFPPSEVREVHSISTAVQRSYLRLRLARWVSRIRCRCRPGTSQEHLLTDVGYPGDSKSCRIEGCRSYLRAPQSRDGNHECDLLPQVCPACCASGSPVAHGVFGCRYSELGPVVAYRWR